MGTRRELEALLTSSMLSRGLGRLYGRLAYVHKAQAVSVKVDETIYRGFFITVMDLDCKVREFRASAGMFDWNAIAAVIVEIAERRLAPRSSAAEVVETKAMPPAADLWKMIGAGLSSHMSMEPSQATPGRVRVKLHELELDPMAALRLYAAVSSVLSPAAAAAG